MASHGELAPRWGLPALQAATAAGALAMFLAALLADYAYWRSHEIQWSNFAAWLLVGAMVLATLALACAAWASARGARGWSLPLLSVTWIAGFADALHHARDAWAVMPGALAWSGLAGVLALAATWLSFARLRGAAGGQAGDVR